MGRAIVRPAARRDLVRHFAYIGENSGLAAARRSPANCQLSQPAHVASSRLRQIADFLPAR